MFLLDDHELVRRGLADLLGVESDIEVVGEASSVAEAMVRIPATKPDVAVLDVRLPDGSGVEVCRDIRSDMPDVKCLMLTSFSDDEALFDAIMAGASGYVLKEIRGNDLVDAIRQVAAGKSLLDPSLTQKVLERLRRGNEEDERLAALSDQERRILELIGEGMTNRQIGEEMHLAEKTVKNYVSSLLAKLGMERRTQAAAFVARLDAEKHSWAGTLQMIRVPPDSATRSAMQSPPSSCARADMLAIPERRPAPSVGRPTPSSVTVRITYGSSNATTTSTLDA